ncbi:unnamed protein product [Cyprideis torosa]|uniref:Uncharacterized protein n=1 Tax=Cyprideis torosa TaxID=163714 RepID=A0A7R8W7J3_9CRUS|nr:unnamed protein product [Cyprideis torosa]CAG0887631.1 unnamed protein product [Cyprideis torosa]
MLAKTAILLLLGYSVLLVVVSSRGISETDDIDKKIPVEEVETDVLERQDLCLLTKRKPPHFRPVRLASWNFMYTEG